MIMEVILLIVLCLLSTVVALGVFVLNEVISDLREIQYILEMRDRE